MQRDLDASGYLYVDAHVLSMPALAAMSLDVVSNSRIPRLRRHLSAALSADAAAVAVRSPMRKAGHFGGAGAAGAVGGGADEGQTATAESASFLSAFLVAAGLRVVEDAR